MPRRDRVVEHATDLVRQWSRDPRRSARLKRKRRRVKRILRAVALMIVLPFVIIPAMIASGLLLGPRGTEGLIWVPLVLIATWSALLYWALRNKRAPLPVAKADVALLPAQTEEWLDQERRRLPSAAQTHVESITRRLEALGPQLQTVDAQAPAAAELRRLLGEELPELVRGYRKVPHALAQQPLYGGASPERQLIEGLETIDAQIGRVHERLAADDLHALATHQRYLELKYKRKEDIDE